MYQNPNIHFPKLMLLLQNYKRLSSYKVNISKTHLLPFNYKPSKEIKHNYTFILEKKQIRYLGVVQDLSKIQERNYTMINNKI